MRTPSGTTFAYSEGAQALSDHAEDLDRVPE